MVVVVVVVLVVLVVVVLLLLQPVADCRAPALPCLAMPCSKGEITIFKCIAIDIQ